MTTPEYSFGTWIKRRRKAVDLTQHELAARVGCSASLIFKIENDERRPSRQIAELLAQHLEIPVDQRELFFKVARQEKAIDSLNPLTLSEPLPRPVSQPRQSNLPTPLTSLVGREHELNSIIQQIQDPACRLLTLTGPGGIGKTRLALEVAHRARDLFADGVCFVSLVGTSSPEFIVPAIADALGFSFSGATELRGQLFHYLSNKQMLLILDNLEHLLNGIELLDELLEQAPRVRLLATSREQLNLRAEWAFEVQGLPVPPNARAEEMESNSAATLFIRRARQVELNLALSAEDLAAIGRICQLVEGSPLGLELAASWVRIMSVREIAGEIERSVDFLTSAIRDMPPRHRSMRAVFDYSWNLLSEDERQVIKRLCVFRGGFTREAADRVAGASLLHLSALVQKSLLRHTPGPPDRYDFHELIRQYAVVKLQEEPEAHTQAHERHASYYAAWLREREKQLQGPALQEALSQISLEIDNLRIAWDWMVTRCQLSNLRDSLVSLFVLHDIRNWIRQGAALFEQAVVALQSHATAKGQDEQRAIALGELMTCQGHMCWHLGEMQKARQLFQQSLEILGKYRDSAMLAELFLYLSILEHSRGDYGAARTLAEECVALNREQGRVPGTGYALSSLGMICLTQGEYETTYKCLEESVRIMRSSQHARGTAITLARFSTAALELGRIGEAEKYLEESLEITRRFHDRWGMGIALHTLGLVACAKGDLGTAESLIRESTNLFHEDGDLLLRASTLSDLGYILLERKAEAEAQDAFGQALHIAKRIGAIPISLYALVGIAMLYAQQGLPERALEVVEFAREHSSASQQTKDRATQLLRVLESQLTQDQIEAVRVRRQPFTLEKFTHEFSLPSLGPN